MLAARAEPARATAPPFRCAVAASLLGAGETEQARKAYVQILKATPTEACARAGLAKINAPPAPHPCAGADSLFDLGDLDAAESAYLALGAQSCASAGLASVAAVRQLCAQGDEERALNHDSEARTAYDAALAKNPQAACAQTGIRKLDGFSFTKLANGIGNWAPRVLTVLFAAIAAVFLILLLGHFRRVHRLFLKVIGVRTLLAPRLAINDLDDSCSGQDTKVGAAVTAQVKTWYQHYRDRAVRDVQRYDLDYATGAERFVTIYSGSDALQDAISSARDISGQSGTVAAILAILYGILPIPKITFNGVLNPSGAGEVAGSLTLHEGAKQAAAQTLTAQTERVDAVKALDFFRLARPAALWIHYETARLATDGKLFSADADEAASFAQLREGIDRQEEGDEAGAERAYEQALRFDRDNWAATVNLAALRARRLDRAREAVAMVEEALGRWRRREGLQ